jgi:hypothetical protein
MLVGQARVAGPGLLCGVRGAGRPVSLRGEAQLYTSYTPPPKASFKAPAASAAEHAAALTLDESIGR